MRDHTQLKAFQIADDLAVQVYVLTRTFPREEQFGLTSQIRRAAVSIASNIVEGSARNSLSDYVHFLDIAYGSACELDYQLSLAFRLGYIDEAHYGTIHELANKTARTLNALINSLRKPAAGARQPASGNRPEAGSPKPVANIQHPEA